MKSTMTMESPTDWRYSEEKMKLRQECLAILLKKYGRDTIPNNGQAIYECCHDWVSQGHKISSGIVAYYKAYYDQTQRPDPISETSSEDR